MLAPMTVELLTIGYEGASAVALLDVREAPVSRKPGFSKRAIEAMLAAAGIGYRHLRDLGTPKPGRDAARAGDIDTFRRIFDAQLASPAGRAALDEAAVLARDGGVCLLCYERDPERCHRSIVAEAIAARTGLAVRHLVP